jgi:multiple antibiotic resistance protein
MYSTLEFTVISLSLIFFIVDPLGNIPIFLSVTEGAAQEERKRVALRSSVATFCILVSFAILGKWILKAFQVTISSFQIAGGVLIFIISLSMLEARRSRTRTTPEEEHERPGEDVSIFPLAIPMMSGPAAITTVMVLMNLSTTLTQKTLVLLAIFLTSVSAYFILRASRHLLTVLGQTGLNVLARLMGLILAVISVQFVIDGLKQVIREISAGG